MAAWTEIVCQVEQVSVHDFDDRPCDEARGDPSFGDHHVDSAFERGMKMMTSPRQWEMAEGQDHRKHVEGHVDDQSQRNASLSETAAWL